MRLAVSLAMLVAACVEPPALPVLPAPVLDLPGTPFDYHQDNGHSTLLATADRLVINAGGQLVEVGIDGVQLPSRFTGTVLQVEASDSWIAFTVGGATAVGIGRIGPQSGVETMTIPMTQWQSLAAGPDGVFFQTMTGKLWSWTTGAPEQLPWTIPTSFLLVSADANYLYGDEDGPIVRYDRLTGARDELISRGPYEYESLVRFEHRGNRILYRRGATLFTLDLSTRKVDTVGEVPGEYWANMTIDDTRAFYGRYRYREGTSAPEHLLGAPRGQLVTASMLVGDQVAWLTQVATDQDPFPGDSKPPTLYMMSSETELE